MKLGTSPLEMLTNTGVVAWGHMFFSLTPGGTGWLHFFTFSMWYAITVDRSVPVSVSVSPAAAYLEAVYVLFLRGVYQDHPYFFMVQVPSLCTVSAGWKVDGRRKAARYGVLFW